MICPCCGNEFSEAQGMDACNGCLARKACGLIKCPTCSYETTREPGIVQRFRSIFSGDKRVRPFPPPRMPADCPVVLSLADLRQGDSASIEKFLNTSEMRKFLALGILPGTRVTVIKDSPAVVLRVGYSEFAFDRDLASTVRVHRLGRA